MRLANDSARTVKSVFDEFAAPEEYTFAKTGAGAARPVRGRETGVALQAKRLYQRFERFRQVVLDFDGVAEIGQAFADELFRVFATAHPGVTLAPINMSIAVAQMVSRALANASDLAKNSGSDG
jgi:hypothetical protein